MHDDPVDELARQADRLLACRISLRYGRPYIGDLCAIPGRRLGMQLDNVSAWGGWQSVNDRPPLELEHVKALGKGPRVAASLDRRHDPRNAPIDGRQVAFGVSAAARPFGVQPRPPLAIGLDGRLDDIRGEQVCLEGRQHSRLDVAQANSPPRAADSASLEHHVRFLKSGATCVYYSVEEWVFQEFMRADSKGMYLNTSIKGRY